MFATLPQLKAMLWINDASQDAKLQFLLDVAWGVLVWLIGDLNEQQYTEYICPCELTNGCNLSFMLKHINVVSIDEVNGTTYTGALWTDYRIQPPNQRKVVFKDLNGYNNTSNFCEYTIVYTAWYATIPTDIQYAQCVLAMLEYSKKDGKDIVKYKLREREVTFASDQTSRFNNLQSIINKYTTLSLTGYGI